MSLEEEVGKLNRQLYAVLEFGEERLPSEQVKDMRKLVAAGEPVIALENFCTQLYEYDVQVRFCSRSVGPASAPEADR